MKEQRPRKAKLIFLNYEVGGIKLPDIKTYYEGVVHKRLKID